MQAGGVDCCNADNQHAAAVVNTASVPKYPAVHPVLFLSVSATAILHAQVTPCVTATLQAVVTFDTLGYGDLTPIGLPEVSAQHSCLSC